MSTRSAFRFLGPPMVMALGILPWSADVGAEPGVGLAYAACGECESNSVTTCIIDDKKEDDACDSSAPPPPNGCPEKTLLY